ncbi:MAG: YybS family protein [Clostridiales bacterium]|nr:YybS family protein [Clostridiales bacterium]
MKQQKECSKRALIEAALIAGIVSVFVLVGAFVPFLSAFLVLLPVPFIFLGVRYRIRYSFLSIVLASLLQGILLGPVYAVFMLILLLPITVAMGIYIKKDKEPVVVVAIGTMASAVSTIFVLQMIGGVDITTNLTEVMKEVLIHQQQMLLSMNLSAIEIETDKMISYFVMMIPAILIIQAMVFAFANYYLCLTCLKRFGIKKKPIYEFSNFKLPKNIVFGSFIIFVLSFLTRYVEGLYHEALIMNVVVIFVFVFFMQGIALINYYMKKAKLNKTARIFLTLVIILIAPIMTLTSFIGVLDSIFSLRK